MLSCDTFALGKDYFIGHQTFLCKNSDRPLGEAQPLLYAAAADHAPGETLRCTHLTLPQAEHTYAVLGSKPYWIWGFEMGANEKGLFIGNEAQGSRCPAESEEGLLGMDLLRLALERTATAREAIALLGTFLSQYGQNANANVRYDRRYENSYLLVDPEEIWLMETAGRQWAATVTPSQTTMTSAQRTWNALPVTGAIFPRVNRCTLQRRIPSRHRARATPCRAGDACAPLFPRTKVRFRSRMPSRSRATTTTARSSLRVSAHAVQTLSASVCTRRTQTARRQPRLCSSAMMMYLA